MSAKKVAMVELIAQFELAQDCFESMAYAYCAYSVCTVAEENPTHPTAEPTAAYCSCVIENGAPDIDLSVDTGLAQFLLDRSNTFVAVEGVASGSLSVARGANQGRTRVIQRRFNVGRGRALLRHARVAGSKRAVPGLVEASLPYDDDPTHDDGDVDDGGRRLYDDLVDDGAAGLDDPADDGAAAWTTRGRRRGRPGRPGLVDDARCLSPLLC
ncbi:hypothetical protein JL722_11802 [Aureococcus anophagefferens]|nr:hypothetical protein JL722_11802 [Aureococcus anophagefferens]